MGLSIITKIVSFFFIIHFENTYAKIYLDDCNRIAQDFYYAGRHCGGRLSVNGAFVFQSRHYRTLAVLKGATNDVRASNYDISKQSENVPNTAESRRENLKSSLMAIATKTKRGFMAKFSDKEKVNSIITELSVLNPTSEPAAAYYDQSKSRPTTSLDDVQYEMPSIAGKWTLIYTDAPDITSLDTSKGSGILSNLRPPPLAELGRIGQECDPPSIKNVIEWYQPSWLNDMTGNDISRRRILQKVCTEGIADSNDPKTVNLDIVGLDIMGDDNINAPENGFFDILDPSSIIRKIGPIELRGIIQSFPFARMRSGFSKCYMNEVEQIIVLKLCYIPNILYRI
uniref:Plastid lipid-associated protein/fibrillin conserved domain-containing protein n=1 Tax=Corethron hystrix TaxID=216773 RepID=A0A7S1BLP8_9STRA|mmetsp:Transcript_33424/g.77098  ORF Transcript_33424/g.77098 Transcript_33424/m.77098 type:complete len:341 (+) Transcript_33424:108-1130(+)